VVVVSSMKLVERACADWEDGWQIPAVGQVGDGGVRIELKGEFPRNCAISTDINVLDRVDYVGRLFRTLWRELGGEWSGRIREIDGEAKDALATNSRLLVAHRSRSFAEVTRDINKRSDNPMARLAFLTLGTTATSLDTTSRLISPTLEQSERVVRDWFAKHEIGLSGLVLENGSGLSRKERITPAQLAAVLKAAYRSNWAPEFEASLPIIGVDGAMEKRLKDSPAAKRGRIKTGSLRNVSSVAGYVPDTNGEMHIVVAIINHDIHEKGPVSAIAKPVLDKLIDWVAHSGASPQR